MNGFGALLGLLALVGGLLFLAGAGLAVVASSQGRSARGGVLLAGIGLVIGVLFSVIGQGLIFVEPTRVAIVINTFNGTVQPPLTGGLHIVTPLVQQVANTYDITQRNFTMSANPEEGSRTGFDAVQANTKDGQTVSMDVTVLYRVIPTEADDLYRTWGTQDFEEGLMRPLTRSVVRDVVSTYSAEEIYGERRAELGPDIKDALTTRLTGAHLELVDLVVREIEFSADFTKAIEDKVVAEQNLEQARTNAQRAETEAQGRAQAQIAAAQGEAQSIEIRAQAQAEALRVVSEQISANPTLIQYLYVQNLSDNVQLILLPSNSPFLFDINSLAQANGNFVAPDVPQGLDSTPEPTPAPGS